MGTKTKALQGSRNRTRLQKHKHNHRHSELPGLRAQVNGRPNLLEDPDPDLPVLPAADERG
jgi:hypothetical protein